MADITQKEIFAQLSAVDVSQYIETKNGLKYLPWSAVYEIIGRSFNFDWGIEFDEDGRDHFGHGLDCYVRCWVEIEGVKRTEQLPIMDYRNVSIPEEKLTATAINKAHRRCMVKACAKFGLGLKVFMGEEIDAPQETEDVTVCPCGSVKGKKFVEIEDEMLLKILSAPLKNGLTAAHKDIIEAILAARKNAASNNNNNK